MLHVQRTHFADEKRKLANSHRGPLGKQLALYLDAAGLIRKGSRIQQAHVSDDCKHPVLLPSDAHFTRLVIQEAHQICLHGGVDATANYVRHAYWIPHIYTKVRSQLRQCVTCKKVNSRHYSTPISPPLPAFRLDTTMPAFHAVGVDYTGEVFVKSPQGGTHKVYIVLYTCATSRGIHLDYVGDLSADEFLNSFRRFTSRKSTPAHIISDNASYFQSSSQHLQGLMNNARVQNYLAEHHMKWTFIPKRAPWHGAFWERLIGTIKRTLQKVLGRAMVTERELYTILTEIEAVTNDRPLTHISSEHDALSPLTPSHLIYGRRVVTLPRSDVEDDDETYHPATHSSVNKRLHFLAHIVTNYWQRFNTEYLVALRDRHKMPDSAGSPPQIAVGDVVLVHDDVRKRSRWKMAVVTKLLPSTQDGLTRVAEIRMDSGTTNRPISRLYPLELSEVPEPVASQQANVTVDATARGRERSRRESAMRAADTIRQWADVINSTD